MSIATIISHTPHWVWILAAFLLYRGVKALQPREMTWPRMLLLPVLFLVWGLYDIVTQLHLPALALAAFAGALVLGASLGWLIAMQQEPARRVGLLIYRPGTPVTLILIVIAFLSKYALSVAVAYHPDLAANAHYNLLYGALSGATDGIFWGGTLCQLYQVFWRRVA
jgi:hypothetical protein